MVGFDGISCFLCCLIYHSLRRIGVASLNSRQIFLVRECVTNILAGGRSGVIGVLDLFCREGNISLHLAPERSLIFKKKYAIVAVVLQVFVDQRLCFFIQSGIRVLPFVEDFLAFGFALFVQSIYFLPLHLREFCVSASARQPLQVERFLKLFIVNSIVYGDLRKDVRISVDIVLPVPLRVCSGIEFQGICDVRIQPHLLVALQTNIFVGRLQENAVRSFVISCTCALALGVKFRKLCVGLVIKNEQSALTVLCAAILEILLLLFGQGFAVAVGIGQSIPKIREAGRLFGEFSSFKIGLNIENDSGRCDILGIGNATVRVSVLCAEIHNKLVVFAHNTLNDAA